MNIIKSEVLESIKGLSHGFIYSEKGIDTEKIAENHELNNIHSLKQIHSDNIIFFEYEAKDISSLQGDSILTKIKREGVSVFTADCVPIIIYEKESGYIAAVHAGWKGTLKEIVSKSVNRIKEVSKDKNYNFVAAIGPAIGKCCYEVGEDVASQFISRFGDNNKFLTHLENGKFLLDLVYLNKSQLEHAGVKEIDILDSCTKCDKLLPSYRRDGKDAGRMLSFIALL